MQKLSIALIIGAAVFISCNTKVSEPSPVDVSLTPTATSTPLPFDHISITGLNGEILGDCTAGVPFTVSITAWADAGETQIAENFDGMSLYLKASNDYSDSFYCISPTMTGYLTAGHTSLGVIMYRATLLPEAKIIVRYGSYTAESSAFTVMAGACTQSLVLPDGLVHTPGLKQIGIPGYKGYEGAADFQEAGVAFGFKVLMVDTNYNRVTAAAQNFPLIRMVSCSSSTSTEIEGFEACAGVYVTITAGQYETDDIVIKKFNADNTEQIYAENFSGIPNFTSVPIPVRHASAAKFEFEAPLNAVVSQPFTITVTAADSYGNVCNDRYTGVPFSNTFNITVLDSNMNSLNPADYQVIGAECANGTAYPEVIINTAGSGFRLRADYGFMTGQSAAFDAAE